MFSAAQNPEFLDRGACLPFLSSLFQNTPSIPSGIQMHFLTLPEGLTWNVFQKRGKIFGHWKKIPNFVFNLTVDKNEDLYKATPLNSKTEQTFQEAHQDQDICQVCGEYNWAKIDTQEGQVSHSDTASK